MFAYLLKRLLAFLPTLLIISMVAFGLSRVPATDPVINCFDPGEEARNQLDLDETKRIYAERAALLNADKPIFYFALNARAYPDTLYRILVKDHRENLENLIAQYGNWEQIEAYFHQIEKLERKTLELEQVEKSENRSTLLRNLRQLPILYQKDVIQTKLKIIQKFCLQDSILEQYLATEVGSLNQKFAAVVSEANPTELYIPDFKWYGLDNQYHHWFSSFLVGDFGLSCQEQRPVSDKIKEVIWWTLIMNICAILLGYLIAIPLGMYSAVNQGKRRDKFITVLLFILYSLPVFWISTLVLIFFATPEYGMQIFPGPGLGDSGMDVPFMTRFWERASHLFLPIICLSYPSFAFLSRQMRGAMGETLKKDFIRTARAKGLSERKVILKHAFRNSLFPLITLFASIFPRVLASGLVVEVIFNIPGMGKLAFDALLSEDWNVVFAVMMLGAILTMIGILVSDLLYAWADPRVRLDG